MDRALERLVADARVRAGVDTIRARDEETLAAQVELSEIPAPPFEESARGDRMGVLMSDAGLYGVCSDPVGNVIGRWPRPEAARPGSDAPLVVSAHLDTVFPPGTDVTVSREGETLRGPGISDDARGLATLLATARALRESGLRTRSPLLFVATVGEEGAGDLRGVKHLFSDRGEARGAAGFISLDGAGLDRVVTRGLGSRRFRITATGPGGHSWVDFGMPNPIHALATVAHRLASLTLPHDPPTALTIARWGGGKSINAIPQTAWLEIDTRSEGDEQLGWLESEMRRTVADIDSVENGPRLGIETIGSRPGGATDADSDLVLAALAATRSQGGAPRITTSSTDANIPMSRGIPAITLGCGGDAGKTHTTQEWYRNVGGVEGVTRAFYTVLLAAGAAV